MLLLCKYMAKYGQNWPKLAKNAIFGRFFGHPGGFLEATDQKPMQNLLILAQTHHYQVSFEIPVGHPHSGFITICVHA